jgi:hypothetical protein
MFSLLRELPLIISRRIVMKDARREFKFDETVILIYFIEFWIQFQPVLWEIYNGLDV